MAPAKDGDRVKVHYTGKLEDGTIFDSSEGGDPLEFSLGKGQLIGGVEKAVLGMEVGEKKTVAIDPKDAYGPYHEDRVRVLEREAIPGHIELKVGAQIGVTREGYPDLVLTVVELDDENVKVDGNHPLAGKILSFDLELGAIG